MFGKANGAAHSLTALRSREHTLTVVVVVAVVAVVAMVAADVRLVVVLLLMRAIMLVLRMERGEVAVGRARATRVQ